jgi:hypothetical protein
MVKKTVNQRSGTTSCNHSSASIIEGTTKTPGRSTLRIDEVACLEMKMIGKPYAGELTYGLMRGNRAVFHGGFYTGASSGMWAFGESLEVLFLVVLFYLLWPISFNVLAGC